MPVGRSVRGCPYSLGTPGFLKTLTQTHRNPYPWGGCGFLRVRVQVTLEYLRVTCDNPYTWSFTTTLHGAIETMGCMLCALAPGYHSPDFSDPHKVAQQCQLTLALPLRGSLVISGGKPLRGLGYPRVFVNPLPIPMKTCARGCRCRF